VKNGDALVGEGIESAALATDQESPAALAEQRLFGGAAALAQMLEVDPAAAAGADCALGQGAGEAAVADVVDGGEPAGPDRCANGGAGRGDGDDVGLGEASVELAALLGQLGPVQRRFERAQQGDRVAVIREGAGCGQARRGQLADHADHRRRVDRAFRSLVI